MVSSVLICDLGRHSWDMGPSKVPAFGGVMQERLGTRGSSCTVTLRTLPISASRKALLLFCDGGEPIPDEEIAQSNISIGTYVPSDSLFDTS